MPRLRRRLRAPAPVPRKKLPQVGDIVDVLWEDRDTYYRGTLQKRVKKAGFWFVVKYFDGDRRIHNLDDEWWMYAGGGEFEPGELEKFDRLEEAAAGDCEKKSCAEGNEDQVVEKSQTEVTYYEKELPLKLRLKMERGKWFEVFRASRICLDKENVVQGSFRNLRPEDLVHIPLTSAIRKKKKTKKGKSLRAVDQEKV